MPSLKVAPWQLAIAAASFIVAFNNNALFVFLLRNLNLRSLAGIGFLASIVLLMALLLFAIFLTAGHGRLLKPIIVLFLVASSIMSYFGNHLGVTFDQGMLLNIADTIVDKNVAEATELASIPLMRHVLLFGIAPSLILVFIHVQSRSFFREIGVRIVVLLVSVALFASVTLPNYRYVVYFARENSDLKFKATPIFPLVSMVRLARDRLKPERPFQVIDPEAVQRQGDNKRLIGIMVVGETARADHFSMGGYDRTTNPLLERIPGVTFAAADSCGTSTLFSVPCMFSMRSRDDYAPDSARSESNVLDILTTAGIKAVWIDNNSSCKHVCDRIEYSNLQENPDKESNHYNGTGYFDEVLLQAVDDYLGRDGEDTLIVLHTLGSHGPAYGRRYPDEFGVFKPFCTRASPADCSQEMVTNAYDNTIFYTDYVLSRLIEKLQARSDEVDSFLFYASDHGESLGENGIYLHGLPYSIAPAGQKNVPFIFWASEGLRGDNSADLEHIADPGGRRLTHDNISHTLLGLYRVNASSYRQNLDLFARPIDTT